MATVLNGKYTSATIFANMVEDGVYEQVYDIINSKAFSGQKVVCMPDVHVGASGPCGLVATIGDYVNPEHVGVDIGCGVSLMMLDKPIPSDKYAEFEHKVKTRIPFGQNIHESPVIDEKDLCQFLTEGFNRYRNYWPEMLSGLPDRVDERWLWQVIHRVNIKPKVFYNSLGTVGGGNHFIEYDESDDGNVAGITLHFGSRNFGLKVCKYWMARTNGALSREEKRAATKKFKDEYIRENKQADGTCKMEGFDKLLQEHLDGLSEGRVSGYLNGDNMKGYLCDMCLAQLYAQYNHITVQRIISEILFKYGIKCKKTITTTHNFIDLNDHTLRKSAIRSYASEEIVIPFNMRDGIAVCVGKSNADWLYSCSHGAGRKMSRTQAKELVTLDEFERSMDGIYSTSVCRETIDESPMAYKDTEEIKELIKETCDVICFLKPKINIKATS